jgi:hypothetical protein
LVPLLKDLSLSRELLRPIQFSMTEEIRTMQLCIYLSHSSRHALLYLPEAYSTISSEPFTLESLTTGYEVQLPSNTTLATLSQILNDAYGIPRNIQGCFTPWWDYEPMYEITNNMTIGDVDDCLEMEYERYFENEAPVGFITCEPVLLKLATTAYTLKA